MNSTCTKSYFLKINRQLEGKGLLVKSGAIIDATLVSSSRRPRKVIEIQEIPEDRKEEQKVKSTDEKSEETPSVDCKVSYSEDTDSTWVKKGNKAHYGKKAHVATDMRDGFIIGGHITPAHIADVTQLEQTLENIKLRGGSIIMADKGYSSKSNREAINSRGYVDLIMHKGFKNNPINATQKFVNRLISKVRYKVEQTFGTLKRLYGFSRWRYIGIKKSQMEFYLVAMAFNLKKAVLKGV